MTRAVSQKPHRLPRETYQGEVTVSITVAVQNRAPLFTRDEVVAAFVDILRGAAERWACLVLVYCFMPDHLHMVLHGKNPGADLWRMTVDFKQRSGYWLHQHIPSISWQKDFHDHVVRQTDDLAAHVRYVLDNPCRKGLVDGWEDYPHKGSIGCSMEEVLAGLPL